MNTHHRAHSIIARVQLLKRLRQGPGTYYIIFLYYYYYRYQRGYCLHRATLLGLSFPQIFRMTTLCSVTVITIVNR